MTNPLEEPTACSRCLARNVCIIHFRLLLEEEPGLHAFLNAYPDRLVHFVLDLGSLQGDLDDIEWEFSQSEELLVVDKQVGDPNGSLAPTIHMSATYKELRKHLGTISFEDDCNADV